MVDNENQWEDDMEYSQTGDDSYEDSYDDSYDEEEYSEDEQGYDEEYDEEYGDEYDEDYEPQKKSGNPLIVILLLFILLGVGGFILYNKFVAGAQQEGSSETQQVFNSEVQVAQSNEQQTNDLAESFFNEAGGDSSDMMSVNFNENGETNVTSGNGADASVATVTDAAPTEKATESDFFAENNETNETPEPAATEEQSNDSIMVVYNKAARLNPFKPPVVDDAQYSADLNNTEFEIIEPPTSSVPDENLTRLLQTQISGILYDEESPSAIVNLNGLDQFVKAGDVVSGYTIDSITKDKVQVSYKNNSYVASVGELFTRGALEKQRAVVNLENKFAGRYKNNN